MDKTMDTMPPMTPAVIPGLSISLNMVCLLVKKRAVNNVESTGCSHSNVFRGVRKAGGTQSTEQDKNSPRLRGLCGPCGVRTRGLRLERAAS